MSWSVYSPALHNRTQYASSPAAPRRLFNPVSYGARSSDDIEARKRLVDPSMRLPPLRMPAQPRTAQERPLSSRMRIEDLLTSTDVAQLKPESVQAPTSCRGIPSTSPLLARVADHTELQWDSFITRYAALPPVLESTSRQHSCEQCSERASSSSAASQMSSPTALSAEMSRRFSPPVSPSNTEITTPPYTYRLTFRQQPFAARACGHGDRDRRVIDPPPILELKINHRVDGAPMRDRDALFMVNCILMDAETGSQAVSEDPDCRMANTLMGASAMSPFSGKDERGFPGTFFIFSDLSCRYQGRFRLRFELVRLDYTKMQPGEKHGIVATAETDVFTAFTAKDFPGMRASTPLLKALKRQGLTVSIKKGSEARKLKGKLRRNSSCDGSESGNSVIGLGKRKANPSRADSPSSHSLSLSKAKRRAYEGPARRV
ncbi:hypothetical protein AMS68_005943 [Peltaster fructicola]|uniref:Velvet domain-containing protein n=1 Tax=Peltaster fructicola TaxID=286661 RepID=A0A6H0Y0G6_9PEZI|nr:hypothetical protein AMS68_005943 [Peltaster fructicola]